MRTRWAGMFTITRRVPRSSGIQRQRSMFGDELLNSRGRADVERRADQRSDAAVVVQAVRLLERLHRDDELGVELVRLRLRVARVLARRREARAQRRHRRIGIARADRRPVRNRRPLRTGGEQFPVRGERGTQPAILHVLRRQRPHGLGGIGRLRDPLHHRHDVRRRTEGPFGQ